MLTSDVNPKDVKLALTGVAKLLHRCDGVSAPLSLPRKPPGSMRNIPAASASISANLIRATKGYECAARR